ncbi:hypothetical protein BAE44_0017727 [Dichanthelium oligosanthes]|uniref:HMA domain-containing protein n=1 Tax=Dichanthelium oligosanthes TaxID=888268 RepID=A0A1E5V878_9POAL|nr:hypothetical protein BAE44_0017727 [Dichanthelium oligosanthes]
MDVLLGVLFDPAVHNPPLEHIQIQYNPHLIVLVLRVSIHCEGCKKKVKKVLQNINGVYRCEIDARSNKVTVTASTKLDPYILVAKLRKSGKQADLWPEQPMPPPQPPAESQSQEPNNQADEQSKPNEPADNAEAAAAEQSNPQPPSEPKQSTAGETPKSAQESKETSSANANTSGEASAAAEQQQQQHQPNEAKGKAKQQRPPEMEKQPVDARVTVEYDRGIGGSYGNHMPAPPQPVHVMSYNQARPSVSASYYAPAPAPAPAPMPMARPGPSQGYIDEHYTPSYYSRPSPYEPYYYNPPPQPSPYRYQYQPASSEDYYYSAPPQRSAFSPPRDGYGDMFNDENANSCSIM